MYILNMNNPIDEEAMCSELVDSFTFDKALTNHQHIGEITLSKSKPIPNTQIRFRRNFLIPEDFSGKSFLDYMADRYAYPDQLEPLQLQSNIYIGYLWNLHRINSIVKRIFRNLPETDRSHHARRQRRAHKAFTGPGIRP